MGLKGETHYALANAWQSALAESMAQARPECRVLSLEWSIWNGAGMGHRLGSLERLARYGVDAIALDDGVDAFERLVLGGAAGTLVVTSRFGPPSNVSLAAIELPMLRFVDNVVLHYPQLELVIETELSLGRDPYLDDHRIDCTAIFPAVFGLEAMAQAAIVVAGDDSPVAVENVSFRQAILIPERSAARIKILALAADDGRVDVVIRGEDDAFATDRMRATFCFGSPLSHRYSSQVNGKSAAPIDARPLYGPLFFQGASFRRLNAYTRLSARRLAASLLEADDRAWFAAFAPQRLVLGDPGVRDALLHALQAAVPHLRVVPVSVKRIALCRGGPPVRMEAVETFATADTFVFDIFGFDSEDFVVECWEGASFQAIGDIMTDPVIAAMPEIAGPFLERVARAATLEESIEIALITGRRTDRKERRVRALAALEVGGPVLARTDRKPLALANGGGVHLSIAHGADFTLAVKALVEIGCDVEAVEKTYRSNGASQLSLSAQSLTADLVASGVEQWPTAASRIWALQEVAIKQNQRVDLPYKIHRTRRNEVVTFETPFGRTATIHVSSLADGMMFAIGTTTSSKRERSTSLSLASAPADHEAAL
jgi:enediyne polyketide synthase